VRDGDGMGVQAAGSGRGRVRGADAGGGWRRLGWKRIFHDREGFGTAWSTKSFMIMEGRRRGLVAEVGG
jgi:hypothetical protein